ncbi:phage major capsid protein [Bordetella avium]|uniref:phage major capsid protein n=1 Tax=Bordetella avium TaxID=521 RepID=UPI000E690C5B|nr:phage major capsid protein [Bordetella avium]AZY50095.1 phage major capsid protein [Bordetella avium]RIQ74569.1 phage major capsid protein [Bordetella avium]
MELKQIIEDLGRSFEEFKSANDQRLAKLAKGEAVESLESKLAKIDADIKRLDDLKSAVEDLEKRANRIGVPGAEDPEAAAYKSGFDKFMRKGDSSEIEQKSVNTGTEADGGYAVPEQLDRQIIQLLGRTTAMRDLARVITIGTPDYKKLANLGGAAGGWVGEEDARPETANPKLGQVSAYMGEIYANPGATQTSLDDLFFNVEQWLNEEANITFSEKENAAYTSGDGVKKPKGFLAYPVALTKDGTRPFGTIQVVDTGTAGTFNGDNLIDLVYEVKKGYRQNGKWAMTTMGLKMARKLKDSEGNYLWQPGLQAGEPSLLLGYPVVENDDMPDPVADALSVGFGDWKRFYTIADRIGTRILRDPYTNKPYVHFYTTKRVGGMVEDSQAVKLLRLKAA